MASENPALIARPAPPAEGRVVLRCPEPVWDGLFEQLCGETDLLEFERSAEGDLIISFLPAALNSRIGALLVGQLAAWAERFGGFPMDASAVYRLTEMVLLSPDVSWLSAEQTAALKAAERPELEIVCPFFVAEVRATAQTWEAQLGKMLDWMEHGCGVGLLVDWIDKRVAVFRAGEEAVVLERPSSLEVDAERMPGLVLELDPIWELTKG